MSMDIFQLYLKGFLKKIARPGTGTAVIFFAIFWIALCKYWCIQNADGRFRWDPIHFAHLPEYHSLQQEGQLCGQHCLNALLQGPYYTAVDLATLAQQLDDEERRRMLEAGENSEEYRRFINQPSSNMDDTGFFSVQVIANALNVWGLELVSYGSTSPVAVQARTNPT